VKHVLRGDVVAGVTVTVYLVPQVMAYAALAGLPAVAGLWSAVAALVVYAALGSSPQLSVGPESTTALMTATALGAAGAAGAGRADLAAALAIVVGVYCLIGWLGRLSFLADLLSRPVLVGYMAGIAGVMVLSQLGRLTRTEVDASLAGLVEVVRNGDRIHVPTLVLGLVTLAAMLVGSMLWSRAPVAMLGMLGATVAVVVLHLEERGVVVTGAIPVGLPELGLPSVQPDRVWPLLVPALAVAFVGYSDNILTARAFAAKGHDRIDARRELLALGAANVGAGLVHGFPVSSSGSRTAIVHAVGGRTRTAALVTAAATLVAILALRPVLERFPAAALGAVVVYAATRLVEVGEFRRILRFRWLEFGIAVTTAISVVVLGPLEGVLVAVALSLMDLIRRVARPHDAVEGLVPGLAGMHNIEDHPEAELVPGLLVYRYDATLFFANADDFASRARAAIAGTSTALRWFVLNAEAIVSIDLTGCDALESLRAELEERGVVFAMARVKQDLLDALAPTGLIDRVGRDRIFPTLPTALEAYNATR
jgi:sulfate permease, SulP family